MDHKEAWGRLFSRLKGKDFSLTSIKLVQVAGVELIVSSPSPSTFKRVKDSYLPLIAETWKELTDESVTARVIMRDAALVPKVLDDGHLLDPKIAEIRKGLRRRQTPAEAPPPLPRLEAIPKKELSASKVTEKRVPNKVKLDVLAAAVKQYYGLPDTRFLLPYPEEPHKRPRLIAMKLAKLYLGEARNSEIGNYFGISGSTVGLQLQRIKKGSAEPGFMKDLQAIRNSLADILPK